MKKNLFLARGIVIRVFLAFILLIFLPVFLSAQMTLTGIAAESKCHGSRLVQYIAESATPVTIVFREEVRIDPSVIFDSLRQPFQMNENDSWKWIRSDRDRSGEVHTRYRQLYKGIPVKDGELIVHIRDGHVVSVNGRWFSGLAVPVKMAVNEADAFSKARDFVNAKQYRWEAEKDASPPSGDLVIVSNPGKPEEPMRVAWRFDLYALQPFSYQSVFIDAETGAVLFSESLIHTIDVPATAATWYSGTQNITCDNYAAGQYRLRETGRGNGIITKNMQQDLYASNAVDFQNNSTSWPVFANGDHAGQDAHWAAENVYDYYSQVHGRNSLDGNGLTLRAYVHFDTASDAAFWDGSSAFFGDGTQQTGGLNPLVAVDVCAHEFSHGLVQHTAGLGNIYENGALNESFADIFGTAVEFFAKPATANFFIAEDCFYDPGRMLRNMQDPNSNLQPDTYLGNYWATGAADFGGIHTNCTVQDYWFYLLCTGGSGINDIGNSWSVSPMGMSEAEQLVYHYLSYFLVSSATYPVASYASILAAEDLYGRCSPEVITVTNGWYAVGIGAPFPYPVSASFTGQEPFGGSLFLTLQVEGQSQSPGTFWWDFGDSSSIAYGNPSMHTYPGGGEYTVTCYFMSDHGCLDTSRQSFFFEGALIPNVFTPNGDNVNDVFTIVSTGFSQYSLEIFDRWGNPVYASVDQNISWDGTHSDGQPCDEGTYFYRLTAISQYGTDFSRTGFITLTGRR